MKNFITNSLCTFLIISLLLGCSSDNQNNEDKTNPPVSNDNTTKVDVPIVVSVVVTSINQDNAISGGNITNQGSSPITGRGVCWSAISEIPTTANSRSIDGIGFGKFTSTLKYLTPNTKYYIRAYVINTTGTGYGEILTFTTPKALPSVVTLDPSSIYYSSANCGGKVTYNDGSQFIAGVCYSSTNTNPDIRDATSNAPILPTNEFGMKLSNLKQDTKYYYKAYITNSSGVFYGNVMSFTTRKLGPPIIRMDGDTQHQTSTAIAYARVDSDGGANITSYGFLWGASTQNLVIENADIGGNIESTIGIGSFTNDKLTFFSSSYHLRVVGTYYVRAYAINSFGIAYGETYSFNH